MRALKSRDLPRLWTAAALAGSLWLTWACGRNLFVQGLGGELATAVRSAAALALAAALAGLAAGFFGRVHGPGRARGWVLAACLGAVALLVLGLGLRIRFGAGHADWAFAWLAFLVVLPALAGLGWGLLRACGLGEEDFGLLLVAGLGAGLGIFGTALFLAALAGWMAAGLVLPILAGWGLLFLERKPLAALLGKALDSAEAFLETRPRRLAAALFAALAFFLLLAALVPTTGWDALSTHLAVPQSWLKAGRVVDSPYLGDTLLPPLPFSLNLAGLMLGPEQLGKVFQWLCLMLSAGAAMRLAWRLRASPWASWAAGLAYLAMPLGFILLYDGMIDELQTALVWGGLLLAMEGGNAGGALVSGVLFGFAMLVKPQGGLYPVCAAAALLAFGLPRREPGLWGRIGLGALAALVASSPWWARNLVETGGIFYPPLFQHGLQAPKSASFMVVRPPAYDLPHMARFLFGVSLIPQRFGPLYLALLPLGVAVAGLRRARHHLWALLVFLACFAVTSVDRWYLPLLPWLAALAGAGLDWRPGPRIWRLALLPALLLQAAVLLGQTLTLGNLRDLEPYLSGRQSRSGFLEAHVDGWRAFQAADALTGSSGRLLVYGETRVFLLGVPYAEADPVWPCQAFDSSGIDSVGALEEKCRQVGATQVLFNWGRPRSPNDAPGRLRMDPLWKKLLKLQGRLEYRGNGFEIYSLDSHARP